MTVGAILAGGGSTRFGGLPKGLERVGDARIVDRVRDALRAIDPSPLLVANAPEAAEWTPGLRVIRDLAPGAGPLAGIQAALHAADDAVLVVAWDMPFVTPELLREIAARGESVAAIVVPEAAPGRPEPACAYYPLACRDALDAFLAGGERKPSRFIEEFGAVERMGTSSLRRFGDPDRLLLSVNSPGALERARGFGG